MSAGWRARFGLVAAGAVLALFGLTAAPFAAYVNDDAFVTYRYGRNLADGVGPFFNAGERVEGYSSLSFVLVTALADRVVGPGGVSPAAKMLGVIASALALLLCLGFARRSAGAAGLSEREGWVWGALAAGLVALSPAVALNSLNGLETGLFALCLMAAVWCDSGAAPRLGWAALWWALVVLTRPEGVLIAGVYLICRGLVRRGLFDRRETEEGSAQASPIATSRLALVVLVAFAAQLLFRYLTYDGELIPNLFYAKAVGSSSSGAWSLSALQTVRAGALAAFLGLPGVALGALGWLAPDSTVAPAESSRMDGGEVGPTEERLALVPLAVTALVGTLLPLVVGNDWTIGWRLTAPYLPLLALVLTFGWIRLTRLGGRRRERVAAALLLGLPLAWLAQSDVRDRLGESVRVNAIGNENGRGAVADWLLDGRVEPGDRIALTDIGLIGYRCIDQRILDGTGQTDRRIARSAGGFLQKDYDPGYLLAQQPEFIVLAYVLAGEPESPPAPDAPIYARGPIERRLSEHPDFDEFYRRPPEDEAVSGEWASRLARRLGAEAVFRHDDPEVHYILAVYRRHVADV